MNEKIYCKTCNTEFKNKGEFVCPKCGEEENIFFIWSLINSHINYCPPNKERCVNLTFKTDKGLPIKCIKCRRKLKKY